LSTCAVVPAAVGCAKALPQQWCLLWANCATSLYLEICDDMMSFFSCVSADCIILLDYQASCWSLYEFRKRGSSTEGGNLWLFGRMSFQMRCSGIYIYSRNMWSVVSYNVSLHKTHVVPHGQFFLWRFSLVSSLFRIMSQRKKMTLFGSGSSWRYIWIARDDAWMNDEIICRLGGVITSYHWRFYSTW
jgi:hypothetical protein